MKTEEKTATVETPPPLRRPPQGSSLDTSSTIAYFAIGIAFASLFLPWMNYTLTSSCTLSSCPAPTVGQANMLSFITGTALPLKSFTGSNMSDAGILQHAITLLTMGTWIIAICFVITILSFFIKNSRQARFALMRKQVSIICLGASIIGVVTTLWTALNISGVNQAAGIHAAPGIGLWGTAAGISILATIVAIAIVRSRTTT